MSTVGAPLHWGYSSLIPEERQARLCRMQTFADVALHVARNVSEIMPEVEELRGAERVVFRLCLNGDAADLFFNGSAGYRAAYCHSIAEGEAANRLIVDTALPQLMSRARAFELKPPFWVEAGLRAPAAKAWVWEKTLAPQGFPWIAPLEQVTYPVWREAAAAWMRDKVDMPHLEGSPRYRNDDRLSFWGVRAPLTPWIEIKGAWMRAGTPTALRKPNRAMQIRQLGWT